MKKLILLSVLILFSCSKEASEPEIIRYNLTVTASDGGSVSSTGGTFSQGTQVSVTATPNAGYSFSGWSDGSTEESITITLSEDTSIEALFEIITLFYLDDNGVTIKAIEDAEIGMQQEFQGNVYKVVSEEELRQMIADGDDLTYIVTSKVTDMSSMFADNQVFNQPIGHWDVSNVISMTLMFHNTIFNQPIGNWDVSNVLEMREMFLNTISFNQPIGDWDVGKVTDMSKMFRGGNPTRLNSFNQDISSWDVSNVETMSDMFGRSIFNQPIGNWDVGKVTDMSYMFYQSKFNQDISSWNVSNVTNMSDMFRDTNFNQPIGDWDVGKVTDMTGMFYKAHSFNQPIGDWNVSNVTRMYSMFYDSPFNQDLSSWNVDNVTGCSSFFHKSGAYVGTSTWTLPKPNFTNCSPYHS